MWWIWSRQGKGRLLRRVAWYDLKEVGWRNVVVHCTRSVLFKGKATYPCSTCCVSFVGWLEIPNLMIAMDNALMIGLVLCSTSVLNNY